MLSNAQQSGNLFYGDASQPRRGRTQHTIRAAPVFHGSPWFDWLRYRGPDGAIRVGQAALVVTARARGWEQLVVRRAEKATARPGCVLTKYVEHGSASPFVCTYPVEHCDSILGIYLCTCCMFCTCVYLICWSRSGHSLLG